MHTPAADTRLMPQGEYKTSGLYMAIALLSAAMIAFQLSLMQILSLLQWYHFAYLVISVALLGFGAAGTALSLFRNRLQKHFHFYLPLLAILSGMAMALATGISQSGIFRFDTYLLFTGYAQAGKLMLTYLLFFLPFFFGALALGLCFDRYVAVIGKIYFANLLGSGIGALAMLLLTWYFFPAQLPALAALLAVIAGICFLFSRKKSGQQNTEGLRIHRLMPLMATAGLLICLWTIIFPPSLQPSQFKDISKTLLLPEAEISWEKSSPFGLMQVVRSPVLRYAPGLSLTAHHGGEAKAALFLNGDWRGAVTGYRSGAGHVLQYSSFHLPYSMAPREKVLVLASGAGQDVLHALSQNVSSVHAVEHNTVLTEALQNALSADNDSAFLNPLVSIYKTSPRFFLRTDTAHYDLIVLPATGSFGGSSGIHALREDFLLTTQAVHDMWHRLKENGVMAVTAWIDFPARHPLKLLATFIEVLEELAIANPLYHIAAIRSWSTISFVIKKTPLTEEEIQNIRNFCETLQFDLALLPGLLDEEKNRYHHLQDSSFLISMNRLFSAAERKALYDEYDFNIRPATDNRPYFSHFVRLKSLPRLAEHFGSRSVPFMELGYLLVILTFFQITVVSVILIVLPLFRLGWKGGSKFSVLLYFSGIGIGFMFTEIVFIQQFILYFGQPVYAAAAVLSSMLVFSGIGSYVSGFFVQKRKILLYFMGAIILLLLLHSAWLSPVLRNTAHAPTGIKLLVVFLLLAPLSFCMGMPFPSGMEHLSHRMPAHIPWAWGINGCLSVISAVLATMVAVETGFSAVLLLAAAAYCLPLWVYGRWKQEL